MKIIDNEGTVKLIFFIGILKWRIVDNDSDTIICTIGTLILSMTFSISTVYLETKFLLLILIQTARSNI